MPRRFKALLAIGIAIVVFSLGLLGGWIMKGMQPPPIVTPIRNMQAGSPLIKPVLYTETPQILSYPKYTPLNAALTAYAASAKAAGKATEVSVYYRDLDSSNWVGINYTDQFNPASMLKVVTLMALLHASEENPLLLDAKITIPASVAIPAGEQDFFPPTDPVQSGNTYTVPDLMSKLITQSDNGANAILIQYIGDNAMSTIFDTLNVPIPSAIGGVTAQQYSHLFRVLYNGSYLSPANSERALELLTKTAFTQGLVAGVPSGTVVAHKFGERTGSGSASDPATVHELHDCGIVYYPDHPYFLCVMTRGSDFTTLTSIIKDISQITWKQVSVLK